MQFFIECASVISCGVLVVNIFDSHFANTLTGFAHIFYYFKTDQNLNLFYKVIKHQMQAMLNCFTGVSCKQKRVAIFSRITGRECYHTFSKPYSTFLPANEHFSVNEKLNMEIPRIDHLHGAQPFQCTG